MSRFRISLLALVLGLVVATPALGQRTRTIVGISAGATTSDIEGGFINTSSQWGFIGGIFGMFRTSRNSLVGLEANYVQKGGRDLADLAYIDVPFLIGAVIPTDNDDLNFNFYTGIGIGFKVSCSENSSSPLSDACDRAKGTEWTWPVGLAFAFRSAGGKYFGLDGRYSLGISDVFDGSASRNRSWQFKALFGIPVG
ncbi:MAG: outer membrane beta-barrel protein [Gemmatimonadetes bacterium]|nr:outer membrane beta-barrel protein [Gemmatimonadota bacterium]